jgi:hypothetical protein
VNPRGQGPNERILEERGQVRRQLTSSKASGESGRVFTLTSPYSPIHLRDLGVGYRIVARHDWVTLPGRNLISARHLVRAVQSLRRQNPGDTAVLHQLLEAAGIRTFFPLQSNSWVTKQDAVIRSIEEGRLVGWEEVPHQVTLRQEIKPETKPSKAPEEKPAEKPKDELNTVSLTLESTYFAPEVEELAIGFRINGPLKQVTGLRLKMVRDAEPGKFILNHVLPIDQATGTFRWKGDVPGFAEGFLTLKDSPYELQLFMETTQGKVESNKQRLSVLPHEVTIRVDDLPIANIDPKHLKAIQGLKKDFADGRPGLLVHKSSLFKVEDEEMNDRTSFDQYKKAFGRGIPVPLFARVRVLGKDGTGKRSPKALHGAKLLWDLTLADDAKYGTQLDDRGVHPTAKKFLTKVSAHKKDDSQPKGRNCHTSLGGERAKAADRGSDLQWKTLDSSWNVSQPSKRGWDALSDFAKQKEDDSGILFIGGRMAGDAYTVRAYLDVDQSLDKEDDAPLNKAGRAFKSNTLSWTHWRRVDVAKMYNVGKATPEIRYGPLNASFQEAAMAILPQAGVKTEEVQERWKQEYQKVLSTHYADDSFIKAAALDDPGLYPTAFRDFAEYQKRAHPMMTSLGNAGKRLLAFFSSEDEEKYKVRCSNYSIDIFLKITEAFSLGEDGLTLFNFGAHGAHNQPPATGIVAGIAPKMPKSSRHRAVFLSFAGGVSGRILIHEIGHHLFLAHAPGHFIEGEQPGGYQEKAHDASEHCVMSYHSSDPEIFCGLCQLKLMGWDYEKISKTGAVS